MDLNQVSDALTQGLLSGYAGKTKFSDVNRSGFNLKSSHFESEKAIYHDEWSNGGGQELVSVGGQLFTRVYAGGVAREDTLKSLKISVPQIIDALKHFITNLTSHTRLFEDCPPQIHGPWSYQYTVIHSSDNPSVTVGKEVIAYSKVIVFVHVFVLSPA